MKRIMLLFVALICIISMGCAVNGKSKEDLYKEKVNHVAQQLMQQYHIPGGLLR